MIKYVGIILALCLSSCVTVTQESVSPDGTRVTQSVTSVGKTKIEEGLLDYKGVFPTVDGGSVEIISGTGVSKLETDADILTLLKYALPILQQVLKASTIAP